jgi:hypothetical protein
MEELVHITLKPGLRNEKQRDSEEHPGRFRFGFARQIDSLAVGGEGVGSVVTPARLDIS